jgi:hypothetical protein
MELGKTWTRDFCTHSATTGAVTDADALPEVRIFEDNSPDPIAYIPTTIQRGVLTGQYCVTIVATEANGFEKGKSYNAIATAAVGGISGKQPVDSFIIEDTMEKLTQAALQVTTPIPDSFVPTMDEFTEIQPPSLDDTYGVNSTHEHKEAFVSYWDIVNKRWTDTTHVPGTLAEDVLAHQASIDAYDVLKADYDLEYSLQREIQWKAYVGGLYIEGTE